jgi:hypothetical protein
MRTGHTARSRARTETAQKSRPMSVTRAHCGLVRVRPRWCAGWQIEADTILNREGPLAISGCWTDRGNRGRRNPLTGSRVSHARSLLRFPNFLLANYQRRRPGDWGEDGRLTRQDSEEGHCRISHFGWPIPRVSSLSLELLVSSYWPDADLTPKISVAVVSPMLLLLLLLMTMHSPPFS